jgi:hypothetical protein
MHEIYIHVHVTVIGVEFSLIYYKYSAWSQFHNKASLRNNY